MRRRPARVAAGTSPSWRGRASCLESAADVAKVRAVVRDSPLRAPVCDSRSAQQRPVFGRPRELISIDVVVRDKNGNVVRGLTAGDFELKEDGQAQQVANFTFQEIWTAPRWRARRPRCWRASKRR